MFTHAHPLTRILPALALFAAISLPALAAEKAAKPEGEKPALEPHPVVKTFYVTGVKDADQAKRISDAVAKLPSVTAVTELTPSSGYVRVAFDTHKIASHLVAQAIADGGASAVTLKFEVPEYSANAQKLDALFAKIGKERQVKIEPTDKAKGEFTLTYLPIKPDPSDPRKVGFNFGHLGHPVHDPAPKGLGLTFKMIEAPQTGATAKASEKKKDPK